MFDLNWDAAGERIYEAGVSRGVLYPSGNDGTYSIGVAWNGLTGITESPSGAEPTPLYANNTKYLTLMSVEELAGTIEAYTYPDEFGVCNGEVAITEGVSIGQQNRSPFGLSYRSEIGNDTNGIKHGYKLHMLYGCMTSPAEQAHATINEDPEVDPMSWEFTTTPVPVNGHDVTASIVIDSTKADPVKLKNLEQILYGKPHELLVDKPEDWSANYSKYFTKTSEGYEKVTSLDGAPSFEKDKYYSDKVAARLPLPDEIATIMKKD